MKDVEEGFIGKKYVVDAESIVTGQKTWNTLEVTVSQLIDGGKQKVSTYKRNYSTLYNTFFPFVHNGRELALYSPEYMYTRVMELPSGIDLGGEDKTTVQTENHFCPTAFYVPVYRKATFTAPSDGKLIDVWLKGKECFDPEYITGNEEGLGPICYCDFGLVAGCVWGDDSSWKIEFLDLSQADKGIVIRDDRLGYVELPRDMKLEDAIDMTIWEPDHHPIIGVTHTDWIDYRKNEGKKTDIK